MLVEFSFELNDRNINVGETLFVRLTSVQVGAGSIGMPLCNR